MVSESFEFESKIGGLEKVGVIGLELRGLELSTSSTFYERGYVVRKIIRLRRCACSKPRPINIGIKSASNRVQLFLVSQLHDKGRNAVLDCIVGLKYDRRVTIYHDQLDR